jgi:hypothetical protein
VPENSDYDKPISGKRLKEALVAATVVLGRAAQDAMLNDLELNGVTFKDRAYTLHEIQSALGKIFGHDGTMLLMQRLKKALE